MAFQDRSLFLAGNVPQLHGFIVSPAGQRLAVGRKSQRLERVTFQRGRQVARPYIPQPQCLIDTAAGEGFAVGREGDRTDDITVARQSTQQLARLDIP